MEKQETMQAQSLTPELIISQVEDAGLSRFSILHLDQQLCFPLYALGRLMQQVYEETLKPFDLTYPQYAVLLVLWEKDGVNVKELGAKLLLDSGTLTPLLKKMEKNGWVHRRRDKKDDRSVLNFASEKARGTKEAVLNLVLTLFCQSTFPIEKIQSLKNELSLFLKHVVQFKSHNEIV